MQLGTIGSALLVVACASGWSPPAPPPAMPEGVWDGADLSFATREAARLTPRVYRVAPLQLLTTRWKAADFIASGKMLEHVRVSDSPLFEHYSTAEPLAQIRARARASLGSEARFRPTYYVANMSAAEFWSARADRYAQYTRHVLDWEETALFARLNLTALAALRVVDRPTTLSFPEANLWLASAGATSSAHWDAVHNFFVQVAGVKRFTVWTARDTTSLHPYPALHPSWFKSQVRAIGALLRARRRRRAQHNGMLPTPRAVRGDTEVEKEVEAEMGSEEREAATLNALIARWPLLRDVAWERAYEVTLRPGDVLYIPPLCMHFVESLTPSIGLSVYTPAVENSVAKAVELMPLPFEAEWSDATMQLALAVFLRIFAEQLEEVDREGNERCQRRARGAAAARDEANEATCAARDPTDGGVELIARLLASRYTAHVALGSVGVHPSKEPPAMGEERAVEETACPFPRSAPASLLQGCAVRALAAMPDVAAATTALRDKFEMYAARLARQFERIRAEGREVWIHDWVERVVYAVLGPRRHGGGGGGGGAEAGECSPTLGGRSIAPFLRAVVLRCTHARRVNEKSR